MFDKFSRDDRMIFAFATQEAADLGHRSLGNDHLILGMLCNARSPIFGLLAEQGLTLDGARTVVRDYHDNHDDWPGDSEPQDRSDDAGRYAEDRAALASIGIDLDRVREAVRDRFGEDLEAGWGDRRGNRRGGGRGRGHRHGRPHPRGGGRRAGSGRDDAFGGQWGDPWADSHFGDPRVAGPDERPRPGGRGRGPRPDGEGPWARPDGAGPSGRPDDEGPWAFGRGRRGPRGHGGRPRWSPSARAAIDAAARRVRRRGERRLSPELVLLGVLEVGDPAAIALIESATTVEALRAAVEATLPETADA